MANINELMEGWGFGKQTAIGTANTFRLRSGVTPTSTQSRGPRSR